MQLERDGCIGIDDDGAHLAGKEPQENEEGKNEVVYIYMRTGMTMRQITSNLEFREVFLFCDIHLQ